MTSVAEVAIWVIYLASTFAAGLLIGRALGALIDQRGHTVESSKPDTPIGGTPNA